MQTRNKEHPSVHLSSHAAYGAGDQAVDARIRLRRGMIILVVFTLLRTVVARLWGFWFGMNYHLSLPFLSFLLVVFLVMSVGLVYLGFTRWVGVDLKSWWFKRGRIKGDILWAVGTLLAGGGLILAVGIGMLALGVMPQNLTASPENTQSLSQLPVDLILGWLFGFGIAAFQEETIFRGFLQSELSQRYGQWAGNLLQAAIFSLLHFGMEPLGTLGNILFLFLFRFASGFLFGWLKMKRGTLLAAGIVHGFIG